MSFGLYPDISKALRAEMAAGTVVILGFVQLDAYPIVGNQHKWDSVGPERSGVW